MASKMENYYMQKNKNLDLNELVKKKLERRIKSYYKIFKENDNKGHFELVCALRREGALTDEEAKYVYNLCKLQYLKDVKPLPPRETKEKKVKLKFNNLDEWAEYRATKGRKFKEQEFYKCLVKNYYRYRQKDLMKLLEEEFKLPVPAGYTKNMWRDYLSRVKVKEV